MKFTFCVEVDVGNEELLKHRVQAAVPDEEIDTVELALRAYFAYGGEVKWAPAEMGFEIIATNVTRSPESRGRPTTSARREEGDKTDATSASRCQFLFAMEIPDEPAFLEWASQVFNDGDPVTFDDAVKHVAAKKVYVVNPPFKFIGEGVVRLGGDEQPLFWPPHMEPQTANGNLDHLDRLVDLCGLPPRGWVCTRAKGHDGPCAAVPAEKWRALDRFLEQSLEVLKEFEEKMKGRVAAMKRINDMP